MRYRHDACYSDHDPTQKMYHVLSFAKAVGRNGAGDHRGEMWRTGWACVTKALNICVKGELRHTWKRTSLIHFLVHYF